jgi:isopentenyl-diphosphate delta-isomerase
MKEQILILVDKADNSLGTAPRTECHTGVGKRHRAFNILLLNKNGEVLLQHRKDVKLGGNRWDGSAGSHVIVGENYQSGAERCLEYEFGIAFPDTLTDCGAFVYEEHYGNNSENEYCKVLAGEWNDGFVPNKEEMDDAKFVPLNEVIKDLKADVGYKKYTKWSHLSIEKFLQHPSTKYKKL